MTLLRFMLLVIGIVGCGPADGIMLDIDTDRPAAFETIEVSVMLAQNLGGPVCAPATRTFPAEELPISIEVHQGVSYGSFAVFMIEGTEDGDKVARRVLQVPFAPGTLLEDTLWLDASCGKACPGQCISGQCVDLRWPRLYDLDPTGEQTPDTCVAED